MAKRQIEIPVHNNSMATSRSLDTNHPDNLNLYESDQEFQDLLKEVKIRFDTNPHFYLKEDYQKLIELIRKKGESGNININVEGDGNVVTDVSSDENNTLIVTKNNISEVTPDYAFWQKEYIKKGAEVLWVPCVNTNNETELEDQSEKLKKVKRVILNFETIGNLKLNTTWLEICRLSDNHLWILNEHILRILNKIDPRKQDYISFRIGITDFKSEENILNMNNGNQTITVPVNNYGIVRIPTEFFINFCKESTLLTLETDFQVSESRPILYIDYRCYFNTIPSKIALYTISWAGSYWKFKHLLETHIRCKYHQLTVDLHNYNGTTLIDRSTWRTYEEPNITINTVHHEGYGKMDICEIKSRAEVENQFANFQFLSVNKNTWQIYPNLDDIVLPDAYYVYLRRSWVNYRYFGAKNTNHTKFRWKMYCSGNTVLLQSSIFYTLIEKIRERGIRHVLENTGRSFYKLTGSHDTFKGGIIHIKIPVGYIRKAQSPSWSNRSAKDYHSRHRIKLFHKTKLACLRIVFRYNHHGKQICIYPEKVPFIMPKICY